MMTMDDDKETYLERTQRLSQLRGTGELSNDDMVGRFALYAPDKRIEVLELIDRDLRSGSSDLRRTASELTTRRRLGEMHVALTKAGR
jgi:hypothetical protein